MESWIRVMKYIVIKSQSLFCSVYSKMIKLSVVYYYCSSRYTWIIMRKGFSDLLAPGMCTVKSTHRD